MIKSESWGKKNGRNVFLYTLSNDTDNSIAVTNYGARVVSLKVPDKNGDPTDVVLGFDSPEAYFKDNAYFGATIGRYANRISGGKFSLDGTEYSLTRNDGQNHLHGGQEGFDSKIWEASIKNDKEEPELEFEYLSKDGKEGYPGNLRVTASYKLTRKSEFIFKMTAVTDQPTIVNITNHNYYNLSGARKKITNHELTVTAEEFTPIDNQGIPLGDILPVEGSPFDFRESGKIGERIDADNRQIRHGQGYDHNFALTTDRTIGPEPDAKVYEPSSGITLRLKTNQPGLQLYTANLLEGNLKGKDGVRYGPRWGLCLEPQNFPDSPNHSNFPSAVVRPGKPYEHKTILDFNPKP
ncbi:MAG: aldose epimerase family protein [Candidatus Bipolaricaulia bacterium]